MEHDKIELENEVEAHIIVNYHSPFHKSADPMVPDDQEEIGISLVFTIHAPSNQIMGKNYPHSFSFNIPVNHPLYTVLEHYVKRQWREEYIEAIKVQYSDAIEDERKRIAHKIIDMDLEQEIMEALDGTITISQLQGRIADKVLNVDGGEK